MMPRKDESRLRSQDRIAGFQAAAKIAREWGGKYGVHQAVTPRAAAAQIAVRIRDSVPLNASDARRAAAGDAAAAVLARFRAYHFNAVMTAKGVAAIINRELSSYARDAARERSPE